MKTDVLAKSRAMAKGNDTCAKIILADPVNYPGIMQEWAQRMATCPKCRVIPCRCEA